MKPELRILCVEDDIEDFEIIRDAVRDYLRFPTRVERAASFLVAQQLMKLETYDALIIDHCLDSPFQDTGLDLARNLALQGYRVPMLLVTERRTPEFNREDQRLMDEGRLHFLSKRDIDSEDFYHWLDLNCDEPVRLLYVEDDPDDRDLVVQMLGESPIYNFNVITRPDIRSAIELLAQREHVFNAFLLDFHLPDGLGTELAERILVMDGGAAITLFTGDPDFDGFKEATQLFARRRVARLYKKDVTAEKLAQAIINSRNAPYGTESAA